MPKIIERNRSLDFVQECAAAGYSDREISKLLGFHRFADFEALLEARPAVEKVIKRGRELFLQTLKK